MSKRAWIATIALGLIILLSIWYGWNSVRIYQVEKADQRQSIAETDARNVYECFNRFDIPLFFTCVYGVAQADAESERSNYDLQAQQEMAVWAYAMFVSTIAVIFITSFAAVFAWQQVTEARRIGEAQTRAYVRIDPPKGLPSVAQILKGFGFEMDVVNYGETPAKGVFIRTQTFVGEFPLPEGHVLPDDWTTMGQGVVIHPGAKNNVSAKGKGLTGMQANECITFEVATRLYMAVKIDYMDVYGISHVEQACFSANYNPEGNRAEHANLHSIST